jgi:DNA adenine methylase
MISRLTTLEDYYNKSKVKEEVYYKFRDEFNDRVKMNELVPSPMCSALFIFLNKTGFNGLYRVNKKGEFNVPWGKKQEVKLYDKAVFDDIAILMSKVKSCVGDYGFIQNLRYENMFIYMDPPYMPEKDESFTSYTATGFSIEEQKRLLDTCNKLNDKGVKFMQSNSNSPIIKEMYSGYNIKEVEVMRLVGAKSESRGKTKEVIITNY